MRIQPDRALQFQFALCAEAVFDMTTAVECDVDRGFNSLFALRRSSTPFQPREVVGHSFNSLFALRRSSTMERDDEGNCPSVSIRSLR